MASLEGGLALEKNVIVEGGFYSLFSISINISVTLCVCKALTLAGSTTTPKPRSRLTANAPTNQDFGSFGTCLFKSILPSCLQSINTILIFVIVPAIMK